MRLIALFGFLALLAVGVVACAGGSVAFPSLAALTSSVTAQPSATASASVSSLSSSGGTLVPPALNGGTLSAVVGYGPVSGGLSGPFVLAAGNYAFAPVVPVPMATPTMPAGIGNVYAVVEANNAGPGNPQFTGSGINATVGSTALAGKSTATVRMWELGAGVGATPVALCLGTNGALPVTVTAATVTFLSPFQAATGASSGTNCSAGGINPWAVNAPLWIVITDN
jgi:hypothetical protein